MNVAVIGVIFLFVAGIIGALLKPTEAEIRAQAAAPAPAADDHGHSGHDSHAHHSH
ncbi:MAG TPA: hypothetical protein VFY29_10830 [Terriglobia bacterium]|nr:hypothetical protein [Terriglobia bacterium]